MQDITFRTELLELLYPGIQRVGISPLDGTVQFYAKVNTVLPPGATVLDYGAGSGRSIQRVGEWRRHLLLMQPNCRRRIGCDVGSEVLSNPYLHEAFLLDPKSCCTLPLAAGSVDLVLADWVIEHLPDPGAAFREIHRVVKPGGWFCARTSNIRYYAYAIRRWVGFGRWGNGLLKRAQPDREERDAYPAFYRGNSARVLMAQLRRQGFENPFITSWEPEPAYLNFSSLALMVGGVYQRAASLGLLPCSTLMAFAKK